MSNRNVLALSCLFMNLFSFAALAESGAATPAVSCSPEVRFQGEITNVAIERGNTRAELVYGSRFHSSSADYDVRKTESSDLSRETYHGKGFKLEVDVEAGTAELKARINGEVIHLSNLKCSFSEFSPHPGVTMGN